jgi:hypothetical protein
VKVEITAIVKSLASYRPSLLSTKEQRLSVVETLLDCALRLVMCAEECGDGLCQCQCQCQCFVPRLAPEAKAVTVNVISTLVVSITVRVVNTSFTVPTVELADGEGSVFVIDVVVNFVIVTGPIDRHLVAGGAKTEELLMLALEPDAVVVKINDVDSATDGVNADMSDMKFQTDEVGEVLCVLEEHGEEIEVTIGKLSGAEKLEVDII